MYFFWKWLFCHRRELLNRFFGTGLTVTQSNPRETISLSLSDCVVCHIAIWDQWILFFEENGHTVTVTAGRNVSMLENFFEPQCKNLVTKLIWEFCGSNKIGLQHTQLGFLWPNWDKCFLLVLCLWLASALARLKHVRLYPVGLFEGESFQTSPYTLEELKTRIIEETSAIPFEMCRKAIQNFRNRQHRCITVEGQHLAEVLFKT